MTPELSHPFLQLPILSSIIKAGDLPVAYRLRHLNRCCKAAVDNAAIWEMLAEKSGYFSVHSREPVNRQQLHRFFKQLRRDFPRDYNIARSLNRPDRTTADIFVQFQKSSLCELWRSITGLSWVYDIHNISLEDLKEAIQSQLRLRESVELTANYLPPWLFSQLNMVKSLFIRDERMVELPATLYGLSKLRTLHLEHFPIENIPDKITSLTNLVSLIFSPYSSTKFPANICSMTNLICLKVNQAFLEHMPSFGESSNLRTLDLSYNRIENFSLSLPRIASLTMNSNRLTSLEEINLPSLRYLSLCGNKLAALPDSFSELQSLEVLFLNHNQFDEMPACIFKMRSLTEVRLRENRMQALPELEVCGIQILDLSCNRLTSIPDYITKLTALQELNLNNQLTIN